MRTAPLLAAACAAALLAACGGPSYVRVRGVSPLNVNDSNESTPVDVRLYQLKDDGRFTRARVEELWTKDKEVLAEDLITQKKITVFPGREDEAPKDIEIGELPADCRFIGVLALFSKADDKGPRHLVIPAKEAKGRVLRFNGSNVKLEN
jgi:type VI secretion system VasD/TssJ family lipoprotein